MLYLINASNFGQIRLPVTIEGGFLIKYIVDGPNGIYDFLGEEEDVSNGQHVNLRYHKHFAYLFVLFNLVRK